MDLDNMTVEERRAYYKSRNMHVHLYPNQIKMSLTDGCNRACSFCCLPKEKKGLKRPDFVSFLEFETNWLPNIPNESKNIQIAQDGEPLYNPHLHLIIQRLKDQNPKRYIAVTTNGDVIKKNPDRLLELYYNDVNSVQIDIYNDFDGMIKSLKQIGDELKELNVKIILTSEGNKLYNNTNPNKRSLIIIKNHFEGKTKTRNLHSCGGSVKMTDEELKETPLNRKCSYPFKHLAISADGTIGMCCVDMNRSVVLGNIKYDNLVDVWNGHKLRAIRSLLEKGRRDLIAPCSMCNVKTFRDGLYPFYQEPVSQYVSTFLIGEITDLNDQQIENLERRLKWKTTKNV